jgi:outer membrane immunogenic protein
VIFPAVLQPGPFLNSASTFSSTRTGWTVGAGVETKIGGGWSAKIEYLYADLGKYTHTLPIALNPAFGAALNNDGVASATTSSPITDNIIRVGLNYQFYR